METPNTLAEFMNVLNRLLQFKLFELNNTPVTITSILVFALALVAIILLSRLFQKFVVKKVLARTGIEPGLQYNFARVIHYLFLAVGILVAIQIVGLNLGALTVIFGLLSVGVGFGLQNVTSNFVAGLILLFERPIKVGDRITVGGIEGDVTAINMRSSMVRSVNNISIIVPNAAFISEQVTNWSHGDRKIRLDVTVGVSYESDLDSVLSTLLEVGENHPRVMKRPKPDVLLTNFGDSSWDMLLRVWIPEATEYPVIRSEINCEIVRKFREHGIAIPFPQRDLHIRSPLPVPIHRSEGTESL
jgi:small-conductance mechanosensitive channel